jgi:cell wall-associated NlpC family hydrolase
MPIPAIFSNLLVLCLFSCQSQDKPSFILTGEKDSTTQAAPSPVKNKAFTGSAIETGSTTPAQLVNYAQSLKGTPYKYGSTDPSQGFDCSGFITYVFNHFGIAVPRSSADFTAVPKEITLKQAKTGDIILFTGTDSTSRTVGHMGILMAHPGQEFSFIHSTSGKANGVTETPLNTYYQGRFMKVIRIFPQNN